MAGAAAVWIVIVGRFISGFGASAISLICKYFLLSKMNTGTKLNFFLPALLKATVYVGELVCSEYRGAFGSALGFSMSLGLQYVILVGEVAPDWRITTVACIIPVILGKNNIENE